MIERKEINAGAKTIRQVLDNVKYTVDFFQREYRWEKKHIEQLLDDLTTKFQSNYEETDEIEEVQNYGRYYLGPIVLSIKKDGKSIIDGQQRLTSITLLLIYLKNLQKGRDNSVDVNKLIFSDWYSKKSFNIYIPERIECIETLYNDKEYDASNKRDSVKNIVERYNDIEELFSEELKGKALPYFVYWLTNNVIFVEITTYSDDDAYKIFETMNDRGLNLTPTEMLKGFILSKMTNDKEKNELNNYWKEEIQELNAVSKDEDLEFFKAWLRAKYAETIRPGRKGAANEDFEKIGTRFHSWVSDNTEKLKLNSGRDYYDFVNKNLKYYSTIYFATKRASMNFNKEYENIYYISERGLASSLSSPLLMSSIKLGEDEATINKKLALISKYLELYVVFRSINYHNYGQSAIRYSMYSLVKEIRDKDVNQLALILKDKVTEMEDNLNGFNKLRMHGQNKRFIKFLLARITTYIEEQSKMPTSFETYMSWWIAKPYQVEHIWSDNFDEHKDEFEQRDEFEEYRNKIGALILLPEGFNQSYGNLPYKQKLPYYYGQNLLAKSLCSQCYERNPDFLSFAKNKELPFKSYEHFKKNDIDERQALYQKILEKIYDVRIFNDVLNDI